MPAATPRLFSKHCFNMKYCELYQHRTQAHFARVIFTILNLCHGNIHGNTKMVFFKFFWTKGHKIIEILVLLTAELSSSKIYKVGMLFAIL